MAVMLCGPTDKELSLTVATLAFTVPVPNVVAPSMKVTSPVTGLEGTEEAAVIVAVRLMIAPAGAGLTAVTKVVVVLIGSMVSEAGPEVLAALLESPA